MNTMQAKNLIDYVKENFNVDGTVFTEHSVARNSCDGEVKESFQCSVFITRHKIERMEANNFYNLCKLVQAKLAAMGLEK